MIRALIPICWQLLICIEAAIGQCPLEWSSSPPQPGVTGNAECCVTWDPDGTGPLPLRVVVGGQDLIGGSGAARQRVLTWDGAQWQGLGNGPGASGTVYALATWNGQLVAGGSFAGGATSNIAAWNGAAWVPLGPGLPNLVLALGTWNGLLVAATSLSGGGTSVHTWNGTAWTTLPAVPQLESATGLVSYQGLLCVAGYRSPSGGALARWNGTSWLPTIVASNTIHAIAVSPSLAVGGTDVLYVAGAFTTINGATAARIAKTSGGAAFAFSQVGNGLPDFCTSLVVRPNGLTGTTVVVAVANSSPLRLASTGAFVAMGTQHLDTVTRFGTTYVGTGIQSVEVVHQYDGSDWQPVRGPGLLDEVRAASRLGADIVVGGSIPSISGVTVNNVARWNGATFSPLGAGLSGASVDVLLELADGDVLAAGDFTSSGATVTNCIARWNGATWSGLGSGVGGQVLALVRMPNGDVIAGGTFASAGGIPAANIARWNGSSWSALGSGTNGTVRALTVRADGRLFAGGSFTVAGGVACSHIAQWNGAAWLPAGAGCNDTVLALAARPGGEIVVSGNFTAAGGTSIRHCARWTGSTWFDMSVPVNNVAVPRSLFALPSGEVIAGAGILPVSPLAGFSRWNGNAWISTGLNVEGWKQTLLIQTVNAIVQRANGSLLVVGAFAAVGGQIAGNLAEVSTPCPATATSYGTGCTTVAGTLTITADSLPWINAVFRTTTTGVAPGSVCLGLIGLSQLSIPLPALLPEGQPGCSLLTSLEIPLSLTSGFGTASSSFALASDTSLIGVPFFQQTIPFEFDLNGAIVAVRASNALSLVIGML